MEKRQKLIEEFFRSLKSKRQISEEEFEGLKYFRLKDDLRSFLRGTIYCEGELIVGYPRIARILTLKEGIKRQISEPFWVEEKADGYNVRVAKIQDKIVAFTRGGYICPFTTDRLAELGNFEAFFKHYPDLVIAGEVVGKNTPYSELYPSYIDAEVAFFAFDLFSKNDWHFFPPEERYQLLSEFNIPQVEHWGPFKYAEISKIEETLRWLNSQGYEGVVIKGSSGRRVKYVLPHINIRDIVFSSHLLLELPPEFFTQRIVRLVLSSLELGVELKDKDYEELGKAFCKGFEKAVKEYLETKKITWRHKLKFKNPKRAELLVNTINRTSRTVRARIVYTQKENEHWIVEIEKTFVRSTSFLSSILEGNLFYD